jgi:tellurite resistance protein TerC
MRYLHYGLAGVLAFAAVKLLIAEWVEIPAPLSIGLIVLMIGASVWPSVRARRRDKRLGKTGGGRPAPAQ